MTVLPVIAGFGGLSSAGRSSCFHSYKRMVSDVLAPQVMESTWRDLAWRMKIPCEGGVSPEIIAAIRAGTLVRRIDSFDPDNIASWQQARLDGTTGPAVFVMPKFRVPQPLPPHWRVEDCESGEVRVTIDGDADVLLPRKMQIGVTSGSNIPAGFDPGAFYNAHHHPRGLRLAVYGASDALNSLGMEWEALLRHIRPDQVSVYAASALGQVDADSMGGIFSRFLSGQRISAKMMPLSLAEMPADFVNSYILNNVGSTGANVGACATFLYNLRQGMMDIQSGKARVVFVGSAEAPLVPEIMEGFNVMGALANDESLRSLDPEGRLDNRRACRPFSTNTGFTLAEASQFVVLMDDALALETGATIYGSVADVFINADANKKSISKPGIGNYVTMAKAAALAKAILGQEGLRQTGVSAHGTGTPQNRVTESHILNEVAKTFALQDWPVVAVKSYLGHSVSAAGGDQLVVALGTWQYGWMPGIKTIDHIAEDVHHSHLRILMDHHHVGDKGENLQAMLLNSKGFGGNNATALLLSPHKTIEMLRKRHGSHALTAWETRNRSVQTVAEAVDAETCRGHENLVYRFGECIIDESAVSMTPTTLSLPGFPTAIDLSMQNPYPDYI